MNDRYRAKKTARSTQWMFLVAATVVLAAAPKFAFAQFFGPSNYRACILKNLDASAPRSAAQLIVNSCRNQFPDIDDTEGGLGIFGPSSFDECIFKYASDARENSVARLIHDSCRKLFPKQNGGPRTSDVRREILLSASETAGKYVKAAATIDEVRESQCASSIGTTDKLPTASQVAYEVLAEFPKSEQPKVKAGLSEMYRTLPSTYNAWGGVDGYIDLLKQRVGNEAACGVLWGEVSGLMGSAETEWSGARSRLRGLSDAR